MEDVTASNGSAIRYAELFTADAEVSWTLSQRHQMEGSSKPLRIRLSVQNLFDKRRSVQDSNGRVTIAFQPSLIDPLGRAIAIRASRAF